MAQEQTQKNLPAAVEQRAIKYDESVNGVTIFKLGGDAGVWVDEETAMEVPAVKSCVSRITKALASMNIAVWRQIPGGAVKMPDHPLSRMLDYKPNKRQPATVFWAGMIENVLKYGNAYAEIIWYKGEPIELRPIPPSRVTIDLVGDELIYKVSNGRGKTATSLNAKDIIHLRTELTDPTDRWGAKGLSPIQAGRAAISVAYAQQTAVSKFYEGGMQHPGFFTVIGGTEETVEQVKEHLGRKVAGVQNSGNIPVFRDNLVYQTLGIDPDKAQLTESRKAQDAQICLCFDFPSAMLYQDATYSGNVVARRAFLDDTLRGLGVFFEVELTTKLLRDPKLSIQFDYDQWLRADQKTQRELMTSDAYNGRKTINEIRAELGDAPVEGGDQIYLPVNVQPLNPTAVSSDELTKLMAMVTKGELTSGQARALLQLASPKVSDDQLSRFFPDTILAEPIPTATTDSQEAPQIDENGPPDISTPVVEPAATALNGAQITSLQGIIEGAAQGLLPLAAVGLILKEAFPTMNAETIAGILASLDGFKPTPPAAPGIAPPAEQQPTVDPADPEKRAKLVEGQRASMADKLNDLLTKEVNARKKAVLTDEWYDKHQQLIEKRVKPVVDACRLNGVVSDDAEEIARAWIDKSKQDLAAHTDGGQDDQALDALLFTWKSTRVEDSCVKHVR